MNERPFITAMLAAPVPKERKRPAKPRLRNLNSNGEESEHSFQRRATVMLNRIVGPFGLTNKWGTLWYGVDSGGPSSDNKRMHDHARGIAAGPFDVDIYDFDRARKIELKTLSGDFTASQMLMVPEYAKARIPHRMARTLQDIVVSLDSFLLPHLDITFIESGRYIVGHDWVNTHGRVAKELESADEIPF